MAIFFKTAGFVVLVFLFFHLANAYQMQQDESTIHATSPSPSPLPQVLDCGVACNIRCGNSSRPNLCKRACGSCCVTCKCVPPGTYGNYDACPCYFNQTTHDNFRKCP